jgi:glucose-1-phosphate adenylyltransferase
MVIPMSLGDYVLSFVMAGGRGTRLNVLTRDRCKPAIEILGRYRILDFVGTNSVNTGIPVMLIAAQFEPSSLITHVGNGEVWGFDEISGKIEVIHPYYREGGSLLRFEGTADSVRKNMDRIDRYNPDIILVLAADHVYTMNYEDVIAQHKAKNADVTIMTNVVPDSKVNHFGIVKIDASGRLVDFVEKPTDIGSIDDFRLTPGMKRRLCVDDPECNFLASMGNYVFFWDRLKAFLEAPGNDFALDMLPAIQEDHGAIYAYVFEHYWRDIGKIRHYFDCNMDFVCGEPPMNLLHHRTKRTELCLPCAWIGSGASTHGVMLSPGDEIHQGSVITNSVLGSQVVIEEGCELDHCVFLGADRIQFSGNTVRRAYTTRIGRGTRLSHVILDKNVWVGQDVEISPRAGTPEERSGILQNTGLKPYRELDEGTVEGDFYIEPETGILVIGKQYDADPKQPILPDGLKC